MPDARIIHTLAFSGHLRAPGKAANSSKPPLAAEPSISHVVAAAQIGCVTWAPRRPVLSHRIIAVRASAEIDLAASVFEVAARARAGTWHYARIACVSGVGSIKEIYRLRTVVDKNERTVLNMRTYAVRKPLDIVDACAGVCGESARPASRRYIAARIRYRSNRSGIAA